MTNDLKNYTNQELINELVTRDINLIKIEEKKNPSLNVIEVLKDEIKQMVNSRHRFREREFNKRFEIAYENIEWIEVCVALYEFVIEYVDELILEVHN